MRNRFIDPETAAIYDWPLNHDTEDVGGKTRNISRTANTGSVGLVKQESDDGPYTLKLSGKIIRRDQFIAMWQWYQRTRSQTIHFRDFDNQTYEVQITSFTPKRVRNQTRPGRDPLQHHWEYQMEMEVYSFVSGDLAAVGVTP